MRALISMVVLAGALSACTWVEPVYEAKSIKALSLSEVSQCQRVGRANASVLSKILFVPRNEQKVTQELLALAKNQAVRLGGDALVAEGLPKAGKQSFIVYRCASQ